MGIKKSKYFKIHELVPEKLYESVHEDLLWSMIDSRLITVIDKLKEKFNHGTMTINNYYWNGDRKWSGIRTKDSKYYSDGSQHSIGNAVDIIFSNYNASDIREYILENQDEFPGIGGVEDFDGMGWVHIDTRDRRNSKIIVFGS